MLGTGIKNHSWELLLNLDILCLENTIRSSVLKYYLEKESMLKKHSLIIVKPMSRRYSILP